MEKSKLTLKVSLFVGKSDEVRDFSIKFNR